MLKTTRTTPTSIDVARLAGVSQSTVSRVVSGNSAVSQETRQLVLDAAKQLGYQTNALAQGLRSGRTGIIGMIWPSSVGYRSDAVVHEFATRMESRGYMVTPMEATGGAEVIPSTLASLAQRRVEAVVMQMPLQLRDAFVGMKELDLFPALTVVSDGDLSQCGLQASTIHHDRQSAAREVAKHFAATGRRCVGAILPIPASQLKLDGLRAGLNSYGLTLPDTHLIPLPGSPPRSNIVELVWQQLDEHVPKAPFDALLCGNDAVAAAACKWFQRRGITIPDDVAIVGFDNDSWTPCMTPELASVERYDRQLVDILERMVMTQLQQPDSPYIHEHLAMKFIWRTSAGGQCPEERNPSASSALVES